MSKMMRFHRYARSVALALLGLPLAASLFAQTPACVAPTNQKLTVYHAGSLSAAFKPLYAAFTCYTGIQITDVFGSSVGLARQCVAAARPCDLYASADYTDIDLFLKPQGYADFTIAFAKGRMVLAYSAREVAAKNLAIADPNSGPFSPPNSIPKASADWYKILTSPGVAIGGALPFMDPGAYRTYLIFQLAQEYYKQPLLYDKLMSHMVVPGPNVPHSVPRLAHSTISSSPTSTTPGPQPKRTTITDTWTCPPRSISLTPRGMTTTRRTPWSFSPAWNHPAAYRPSLFMQRAWHGALPC